MENNIKFLVMDVDGTLTDGKLNIGPEGELFKSFSVKDGCGIKDILPDYGVIPIIITARRSEIVEKRCMELAINELHQGCRDKLGKLEELLKYYSERCDVQYELRNVAYIGDDFLDLKPMQAIKSEGGIVGAPKDAIKCILEFADYVAEHNGGDGAVRDFIEWLVDKCKF